MKQLLSLILFTILITAADNVHANENSPTVTEVILKPGTGNNQGKKRTPAKVLVLQVYLGDVTIADFLGHSSYFIDFYKENSTTRTATLTTYTPTAYVNLEPGCYTVTCTAEDGSVYVGELTI